MSAPKWTKAQSRAIGYAGGDLLLSAAAGSGKTATLTQRIVSLLTAPDSTAEISRILAVTFTRSAAAELKERIGKALREAIRENGASSRLSRQLCDLGRAQITTIHSFCLHILRPHFAELSLPAGFSVAEEAEIRTLSVRVMGDVISSFFEEGDEDFLKMADALSSPRSESSLDGVLLELANTLSSHGMDGMDLARLADGLSGMTAFFDSPAGAGTRARVRRFAAHYRNYFADVCAEFAKDELFAARYLPAAEAAFRLSDGLLAAADRGDYDGCRAVLNAYDPPRLGVIRAENQTPAGLYFKEVRDTFKEEITRLRTRSFALSEADTALTTLRTAEIARAAARVLQVYFEEMAREKKERGVVDFADLERMAVRLLVDENGNPTDAAREIAASYDYIFIDEYQDTNAAQDAIFAAVSGNSHRFMVGDIKQSIYRFRGAEPEVFASYRRKWMPLSETEEAPAAASLFMRENFRCDKPVVDFVNLVSRHMFKRGTIPFTEEDELAFGKSVPPAYEPAPVEITLLPKDTADGPAPVTEPVFVAAKISELLRTGRRADGVPLTPGDVAILLRSPGADGAAFAEALEARGIPVSNRTRASLYTQPEVLYVLSILRAVDNPGRDIDLAAAMRGPVFGFSLSDLICIRRACPAGSLWDAVRTAAGILPVEADAEPAEEPLAVRCRAFAEDLAALRADARGMRADTLLLRLYGETGIEEIAAADPERDAVFAAANLRALYDAARRFENGPGGGLYPFLKQIESAVEAGEETAAEDGTPAVRIMSIHQSKGLEFPVCFLSRADKRRNTRDSVDALLFDPVLGAAMRLPDEGGLVRCDTPLRQSVAAAIADASVEEEMRVLYVALTRARERLIVTAAVPHPEEMAARAEENPGVPFFSPETVLSAPNYITWMLDAVAEARFLGEDVDSVRVTVAGESEAEAEASAVPADKPEADVPAEEIGRLTQQLETQIRTPYRYRHLAAVPAKLTVSRLYPGILDDDGELSSIGAKAALPDMGEKNAPPAFLSGKTEFEASFAGTATHVFLQFADFDRLSETDVLAERDRLLAAGFFTKEMADAMRMDELERFIRSELFARMKNARWIRREFRFNAALPAAEFTKDETLAKELSASKTDVIVQGVIDALFMDENGKIVLVDYKTDRLTPAETADARLAAEKLVPRHGEQLSYYRTVCADMLGEPVEECLIYSLPLGDTVNVP